MYSLFTRRVLDCEQYIQLEIKEMLQVEGRCGHSIIVNFSFDV